jgi:serine phosphatase RsbU (regulator of sigma subunit)
VNAAVKSSHWHPVGLYSPAEQQLAPAQLPSVEGYAFDPAYVPAAEVGGDLYQVFEQSDVPR